ncbi:MAG: undecaprenyl-diphosphate phosphatase [Alphaproteobacteria bacterium]|nr:undecaprenyl-diphosphate phosphatase [Alphaproteobacteria bacterium]
MSDINILWLAFIQGFTEFLPVSSSGHLVLFAKYVSQIDQGQAIDIALHLGSLIAVCLYFSHTIKEMVYSLWQQKFRPNFDVLGVKIAYFILIATIPAIIIGGVLSFIGMEWIRNTKLIAFLLIFYSILLLYADTSFSTQKTLQDISLKDALLIGFAQTLAFFPGTSRSGITITMGRFLGYNRSEVAKFSMLLSVPSILAAGVVAYIDLYQTGDISQLFLGGKAIFWSFIFSLIAIVFMMKWLRTKTFLPFVIYRIILGIVLLLDGYNFI